MLPRIRPMRLRLVKQPFDHADYIFELKHDGFRAVTYIQNGECKLISRNQNNLRFTSLKQALATLRVENAIIDGEVVCIDEHGVSQFNWLLDRQHEPVLYAFDLLWLNSEDLRGRSLIERKRRLSKLIASSKCTRIIYAQHIEREGKRFFEEACARDLEGIVAKRKLGVYKDDGRGWIKIKNRAYTEADGRHELLASKK